MKTREGFHILAAIILLAVVSSVWSIIRKDWAAVGMIALFSIVVIGVHVATKKIMAYLLDASVEHKIWSVSRYGIKAHSHFEKPIPGGVIFPLIFSVFSLGYLKVMTFLTYETSALKVRAAKRFGFYSFSEMTEWHNGLIGAAGIFCVLLLSFISYFPGLPGLETLSKIAAFYAFWNMLPISNLDGAQIFFGSKVLWATLGIITLIFTAYALIL